MEGRRDYWTKAVPTEMKAEMSKQLSDDVEAFLANGGKINNISKGDSAQHIHEWRLQYKNDNDATKSYKERAAESKRKGQNGWVK